MINHTATLPLFPKLGSSEYEYAAGQPTAPSKPPYADTGATGIFLRRQDVDSAFMSAERPSTQPIRVKLPNGDIITSSAQATYSIPSTDIELPVHIFNDNVLHVSLCGISPFTAAGCEVLFRGDAVEVTYKGKIILQAKKRLNDTLWPMPLPTLTAGQQHHDTTEPHTANLIVRHENDRDLVAFVHQTLGSPAQSSFEKSVKRGWCNFPGITYEKVSRNKTNVEATAFGHLDQQRPHHRTAAKTTVPTSTKRPSISEPVDYEQDHEDDDHELEGIDPRIYLKIEASARPTTNFSDATGMTACPTRQGQKYNLISTYNGYVHYEPMMTREKGSYVEAFKLTLAFYRRHKVRIEIQILDNEKSKLLEQYLQTQEGVQVHYCPPKNHRSNRAERAIRTGKNHVIGVSATTDANCPDNLWGDFLEQAEITLNILLPWRLDPNRSAYHGLTGAKFDFERHPMAPAGMRVTLFKHPDDRLSWGNHGVKGYYVGPAMDHYRCFRVYDPRTNRVLITDTLSWYPHAVVMPGASSSELVAAQLDNYTHRLDSYLSRSNTEPTLRPQLRDFILHRDMYFASPPVSPPPTAEEQRVAPPPVTPAREQRVASPAPPAQTAAPQQSVAPAQGTMPQPGAAPYQDAPPQQPPAPADQAPPPARQVAVLRRPDLARRRRAAPSSSTTATPHARHRDSGPCPRPTTARHGHGRTATPHEAQPTTPTARPACSSPHSSAGRAASSVAQAQQAHRQAKKKGYAAPCPRCPPSRQHRPRLPAALHT
jgi:hypothetical protein